MKLFIPAAKGVLNLIYDAHKLFPVKHKLTMISRQQDEPSYDMLAIKKRMAAERPDVEVKILCKEIGKGITGKISYGAHMLGPQLHSFATSKIILLDGYCISASILRHKKELKIVQMWHAMGCFKKFGRSILGDKEGSSKELAEAMNMHEGYDLFIASSQDSLRCFADAFGQPESKGHVMPLPRYDFLTSNSQMDAMRRQILAVFPELAGRKNILYAPTFRKNDHAEDGFSELLEAAQSAGYNMIFSPHPLMEQAEEQEQYIIQGYSAMQLMSVCECLVTDYSALVFEAAAAGLATYLFIYDRDKYAEERNFYIDLDTDVDLPKYNHAREVMDSISRHECSKERLARFADRYIKKTDDATGDIVKMLSDML